MHGHSVVSRLVAAISFACPVPIRGAVRYSPRYLPSHRRPFLSRYRLRCPVFIEPCLLKSLGRPVRSLGTHRVMHPPAASKSQNIWITGLHRLAGPLPPSVRLPSEGWSAVVCCDVCNVALLNKLRNSIAKLLCFLTTYVSTYRGAGIKKPPRGRLLWVVCGA